jgi:hypothetical protein
MTGPVKRPLLWTFWVVVIFSLAVGAAGCQQELPRGSSKPVINPRKSFDAIMKRFTQYFDGIDVVLPPSRLGRDGTVQQMRMRLVVEDIRYAVHGCNGPQEPCTAELTVRTRSQLSLLDPPDEDENLDHAEDTAKSGDSHSKPETQNPPVKRGGGESQGENKHDVVTPLTNNELLRSRGIQSEQTYQFAYEHGRWVLKSEPQDALVMGAIDSALDGQ